MLFSRTSCLIIGGLKSLDLPVSDIHHDNNAKQLHYYPPPPPPPKKKKKKKKKFKCFQSFEKYCLIMYTENAFISRYFVLQKSVFYSNSPLTHVSRACGSYWLLVWLFWLNNWTLCLEFFICARCKMRATAMLNPGVWFLRYHASNSSLTLLTSLRHLNISVRIIIISPPKIQSEAILFTI